jgi:hypothetical protein
LEARPIVAGGSQTLPQIAEAGAHAVADRHAFYCEGRIVCELRADVIERQTSKVTLMDGHNDLLRSKSDQDAKNDDANLAGELAPTVQWLW